MPLPRPKSAKSEAFKRGVRELVRTGRKPKVALAIMFKQTRKYGDK